MLQRDAAKGITEEDARKRLGSQMPLSQKLLYADVVIDNSVTAADAVPPRLRGEVGHLCARWRREAREPLRRLLWLLSWSVPPFGRVYGLVVVRARLAALRRREAKMSHGKL